MLKHEQLLNDSIKTYQEIGNCYENIHAYALNDNNSEKIEQQTRLIDIFSKKVKEIDDQLKTILPSNPQLNNRARQLVNKRESCIKSLLSQNTNIANRASNIASLLKHDFSNLAKNNSAITQYSQSIPSKKKTIFTKSY